MLCLRLHSIDGNRGFVLLQGVPSCIKYFGVDYVYTATPADTTTHTHTCKTHLPHWKRLAHANPYNQWKRIPIRYNFGIFKTNRKSIGNTIFFFSLFSQLIRSHRFPYCIVIGFRLNYLFGMVPLFLPRWLSFFKSPHN